MALKKGYKQMLEEAQAKIQTLSADEAKDRQFVLFCQSGWRSALVASTLQDMGLTRVSIIAGGYQGWKEPGGATAAAKARS